MYLMVQLLSWEVSLPHQRLQGQRVLTYSLIPSEKSQSSIWLTMRVRVSTAVERRLLWITPTAMHFNSLTEMEQ